MALYMYICTVTKKKSYTRPSGEIILRMTERERVHCGRICCIERTRGVLVEYGGGGQPQTQGTCLRAVWVVTGWDSCYSCHGLAANPGDPEDTCLPCCIGLSRDGTLLQLSWDETTICRALLSFLGLSRDTVPKL